MAAVVETTIGSFTIDLFIDEVPLLAANFLKLCALDAYKFSSFTRVEKNYLAEGGLLPEINSNGEELLNQVDASIMTLLKQSVSASEFNKLLEKNRDSIYKQNFFDINTGFIREQIHPKLNFNKKGTVAMNKSSMHGSAFCISLSDNLDFLSEKLSVIGYVSENLEIIDKFNKVLTENYVNFKPLMPVQITAIHVLDDPFPNPAGFSRIKPFRHLNVEPYSSKKENKSQNDSEPMIQEEIAAYENLAKSEAKSRAVALEILGDLPDADLAPPDTCLFICKLNPVTEAEDLKLIFSRFGKILSCDIVRDWKTGNSLQYGFIEFENSKACETAIFKMEGCLIDDRRVHVDFCQSVSKQWSLFQRDKKKKASASEKKSDFKTEKDFVFKKRKTQH